MTRETRIAISFGLIMFIVSVIVNVAFEYLFVDLIEMPLWPLEQAALYIFLTFCITICVISAVYVVMKFSEINTLQGFIRLGIIFIVAMITNNGVYYSLKEIFNK